jgi:geranylgeranyl pyrophosphate synthase
MLLEKISSSADLKNIRKEDLPVLAEEIREKIVNDISKTGGHLASSLGVVDLTIALHYVFEDKTKLGKRVSDQDNNKLTAFSLDGKDKAWALATRHIKTAKSKIKFFGKKAIALEGLADFILERDY